jgi:YD repeat-containing protein
VSTTNQINVSSPTTVHDPAGNQTNIGAYGFAYDAEGRMTSATFSTYNRHVGHVGMWGQPEQPRDHFRHPGHPHPYFSE